MSATNILILTLLTKLVAPHPYGKQTRVAFLHCVLNCPPLNYASLVYGWAWNCGNFFSGSWYLPDNLQKRSIVRVQKPSSPTILNSILKWKKNIEIEVFQIPYIFIEDHLKNCNLNFVLIKKRLCLGVTQLRCQFSLRGSLKINWKKCWSKFN